MNLMKITLIFYYKGIQFGKIYITVIIKLLKILIFSKYFLKENYSLKRKIFAFIFILSLRIVVFFQLPVPILKSFLEKDISLFT